VKCSHGVTADVGAPTDRARDRECPSERLCDETVVDPAAVTGVRAAVRDRAERGVDVIEVMAGGGDLTPARARARPITRRMSCVRPWMRRAATALAAARNRRDRQAAGSVFKRR
jgi:hypothetical protein